MKFTPEQLASKEAELNDAQRILREAADLVQRLTTSLELMREEKDTRGEEIASHVFRVADGWMMMERCDRPGHPRNLFLFRTQSNHESPDDLLPLMRASLSSLIDREIASADERAREACRKALKRAYGGWSEATGVDGPYRLYAFGENPLDVIREAR